MYRLSLLALLAIVGCQSDHDLNSIKDGVGGPDGEDDNPDDGDGNTDPVENPGALVGRICSPSGDSWVSNAYVYVTYDGVVYDTYTDQEGWFTLTGLPAGVHIVYVEKGSFSTSFEVLIEENQTTELPVEECLGDDVAIAVVTGDYDSIEVFLADLGLSFDVYDGLYSTEYIDFLRDPAAVSEYDIIFINCNTNTGWSTYRNQISSTLRQFVQGGGSIYASDYSYYFIETAVPEAAEFPGDDATPFAAWGEGMSGYVTGDIVDPGLAAAMGKDTVSLNYNTVWVPIDSTAGATLIEGNYESYWGYEHGPLVVQYGLGGGTVLYTSFHNEAQATQDMDRLIEEFIYSL